jgi:hypothetical protein
MVAKLIRPSTNGNLDHQEAVCGVDSMTDFEWCYSDFLCEWREHRNMKSLSLLFLVNTLHIRAQGVEHLW